MEQAGERRSGRLFLSFHARVKPTAQFRKRSGMEQCVLMSGGGLGR
jgi:hypothetical protein